MKGEWIEEYPCGCTHVEKRKEDLLGYCKYHGEDWINIYKLPESTECGHSEDLSD